MSPFDPAAAARVLAGELRALGNPERAGAHLGARRLARGRHRRSALLALLAGIRAGQPDLPRLERYALGMLAEKEFFIRKAIGWVVREISKRDPAWVTAWTAAHAREMSGVTFREGVRRLPPATAGQLRALREGMNPARAKKHPA